MDCVLAGIQWSSSLVYIDDVIIIGGSFEALAPLSTSFRLFEASWSENSTQQMSLPTA